jgi:nucleoside-diphosphate-sugar epimerase
VKALVTGAGGFVGANLVRYLHAHDHEPVAVIRPGGDGWRLTGLDDAVQILPIDLLEPAAVVEAIRVTRPDVIFHLAASGAYSWQTNLDAMIGVNVRATASVLEGARLVNASVINAGSSSEYGFRDAPAREQDRLQPNSLYAVTKAAGTHLCSLAAQAEGQPVVTLRLYSVYGPWEEPGRLMPTLVALALRGHLPPLVAPDTVRDFVWIEDVCRAFVAAAQTSDRLGGSVLNLASGQQTTLRQLVALVQQLFVVGEVPAWGEMPNRAWDAAVWVGDTSETQRQLDWQATTTLPDGLRSFADWFAEDPTRLDLYDQQQQSPRTEPPAAREKVLR